MVTVLVAGVVATSGLPAGADPVRDSQWPLGFMRIAEAQRISQGEGVTVAVLDTGVDQNQPDIAGNVLEGIDGWSTARDGRSDPDGHGTAVSALIAGHGHGAGGTDGILGIAPKAKILPVTIWPPGNRSDAAKDIITGIRWSVDHGAQIICIAGAGSSIAGMEDAVKYAVDKGVPVIAGAGNVSQQATIGYPAAFPDAIGVSGVDEQGNFARSVSVSGIGVDLSAPAVNMQIPKAGGGYTKAQGTSLSTAFVAGAAALVKAKFPTLNAEQLFERLKATAIDKGPTGLDDEYGWGVVDPLAALTKNVAGSNGSPSARPEVTASAAGTADGDEGSGSHKVLIGAALAGGLVIVLVILAASLIGLRRRRSPLR